MPKDMKEMMGPPSGGKGKKKASYLDGKAPELVSYLLDATDGDEAKAEALCRAIEFNAAPPMPEEEEEMGEMGGMMGPPL